MYFFLYLHLYHLLYKALSLILVKPSKCKYQWQNASKRACPRRHVQRYRQAERLGTGYAAACSSAPRRRRRLSSTCTKGWNLSSKTSPYWRRYKLQNRRLPVQILLLRQSGLRNTSSIKPSEPIPTLRPNTPSIWKLRERCEIALPLGVYGGCSDWTFVQKGGENWPITISQWQLQLKVILEKLVVKRE